MNRVRAASFQRESISCVSGRKGATVHMMVRAGEFQAAAFPEITGSVRLRDIQLKKTVTWATPRELSPTLTAGLFL